MKSVSHFCRYKRTDSTCDLKQNKLTVIKRQSEFQVEQLFRYIFSTNDNSMGMWEYILHLWSGEVEQMNNRLIYR